MFIDIDCSQLKNIIRMLTVIILFQKGIPMKLSLLLFYPMVWVVELRQIFYLV